ncbi:MAG: glycine cleavage system H protein [Zhongshania sp.]|jgi:glycine cleavage system H protein
MSNTPSELKYASSHEWARLESDGTVTIGISYHAQNALGDVVYIELPEVGAEYSAGDECAVVESVKAASDIYAPISGEIVEVNEALDESPETVNEYPYSDGWFFRIQPSDLSELDNLLDAEAYDEQCDE